MGKHTQQAHTKTPKCQDTEVGTTNHLGTTGSLPGKRRRESGNIGRMKRARLKGNVNGNGRGRQGCASSSERMTARGHWDLPMIDTSSERMPARENGDSTMHNTGGARITARGHWDLTMHNTRSASQR